MDSDPDRMRVRDCARTNRLRRLTHRDANCVLDMWSMVRRDHMVLRYSSSARLGSHEQAVRVCDCDRTSELNIGAFDGLSLTGIVTLVFSRDLPQAEIALIVRSDLQNQGIGLALLAGAVQIAAAHGQRSIWGEAFADNVPTLRLSRRLGADIQYSPDAPYIIRATLTLCAAKSSIGESYPPIEFSLLRGTPPDTCG